MLLDASILAKKLEAAKLEQNASKLRKQNRDATKRGSYVPQHAATQFTATTTQVSKDQGEGELKRSKSKQEVTEAPKLSRSKGEATAGPKRSKSNEERKSGAERTSSTKQQRLSLAPPERADTKRKRQSLTIRCSAGGNPCINPKQMIGALNMGMSESEAAYQPPKRDSMMHSIDGIAALSTSPEILDKPKRNSSTRGYKPGDAAKRNLEKRRSKLVPAKHGSMTIYEQAEFADMRTSLDEIPEFRTARAKDNDMPYDMDLIAEDDMQPLVHQQRPRIQPNDRPNWTQRSQCGDDMRHMLNLPLMQKKDKAQRMQDDVQKQSGPRQELGDGFEPQGLRPQMSRLKTTGDLPENLISNAVHKIKKEERIKRRQSLIGFFKRL